VLRHPQYRHQPWTRSLVSQLIFWIAVNIVIGFSVKFIDNAAHIAGLITGLLLGFLPQRVPPPSPREMVIDVASAPPENQP
jgi:membrane associated rhomboid family serine protease